MDAESYKRLYYRYRELYYQTHAELTEVSEQCKVWKDAYDERMAWWHDSIGKCMLNAYNYIHESKERLSSFLTWERSMKLA